MQNFVLYSVVLSEPSPESLNKKKTTKIQNYKTSKWFEVTLATSIPKFLHEESTPQSFKERHSMHNLVLYSVVLSQRSPGSLNIKPTTKKTKFRELQLIRDGSRTRIPKILHEGDSPQSFKERHSMQNFVLYSVVLLARSPSAINKKKKTKNRKILRTEIDLRLLS